MAFKYNKFKYNPYEESQEVKDNRAAYQSIANNQPAAWDGGKYGSLRDDAMNKILNRDSFSYDLNGDALYQQYKNQYINQGRQAMMDTMGQAAALTGGYGNSYAQTVGQQTYNGYLGQLNDKIPELYQLALQKYQMDGDQLMQNYGVLNDAYGTEYGQYRDNVGDWQNNRAFLYGVLNDSRNFDYGKWNDTTNLNYNIWNDDTARGYQIYRDGIADQQWQDTFDYQTHRDDIADQQWERQQTYNEKSDYQSTLARGGETALAAGQMPSDPQLQAMGITKQQAEGIIAGIGTGDSNNSNNSSNNSSTKTTKTPKTTQYNTHGYTTKEIKKLQHAAGIAEDGVWGPDTEKAYKAGFRPDSKPKDGNQTGTYNFSELLTAAAAGMSYKQIADVLKDRGIKITDVVEADIRKALSK